MSILNNLTGSIELNQRTGTVVTLETEKTFVTDDIVLNLSAKLDSPSFTGGEPSGTATFGTLTNCELSENNTSGIIITTGGTCSRAALTYNDEVNGWVTASSGTTPTGAGASNAENLATQTRYLTKVTLTNNKTFQIEVPNGSPENTITFTFSVDNNGNTTIE